MNNKITNDNAKDLTYLVIFSHHMFWLDAHRSRDRNQVAEASVYMVALFLVMHRKTSEKSKRLTARLATKRRKCKVFLVFPTSSYIA